MIKTAQIKFKNGDYAYDYKTNLDLKIGDLAIVDALHGYTIVQVVNVLDYTASKASKWIVDKIDIDRYKKMLKEEQDLVNLKQKMMAREKELKDMKHYEVLAKDDKEMAELFDEYKELIK